MRYSHIKDLREYMQLCYFKKKYFISSRDGTIENNFNAIGRCLRYKSGDDGFFRNEFTKYKHLHFIRSEKQHFLIDHPLNKGEINVFIIDWRYYEGLQSHEEVQSNLFNKINLERILTIIDCLIRN